MDINHQPYNAAREIEFIDGLGAFGINEKSVSNIKSRKELLSNYLIAAKKRTNWGSIDKHIVIQHVKIALLAA